MDSTAVMAAQAGEQGASEPDEQQQSIPQEPILQEKRNVQALKTMYERQDMVAVISGRSRLPVCKDKPISTPSGRESTASTPNVPAWMQPHVADTDQPEQTASATKDIGTQTEDSACARCAAADSPTPDSPSAFTRVPSIIDHVPCKANSADSAQQEWQGGATQTAESHSCSSTGSMDRNSVGARLPSTESSSCSEGPWGAPCRTPTSQPGPQRVSHSRPVSPVSCASSRGGSIRAYTRGPTGPHAWGSMQRALSVRSSVHSDAGYHQMVQYPSLAAAYVRQWEADVLLADVTGEHEESKLPGVVEVPATRYEPPTSPTHYHHPAPRYTPFTTHHCQHSPSRSPTWRATPSAGPPMHHVAPPETLRPHFSYSVSSTASGSNVFLPQHSSRSFHLSRASSKGPLEGAPMGPWQEHGVGVLSNADLAGMDGTEGVLYAKGSNTSPLRGYKGAVSSPKSPGKLRKFLSARARC